MVPVWNCVAYYGARFFNRGRVHYDLSIWLDGKIPFLPWTVIIYFGCFAVWVINYILAAKQDEEDAWRLFAADFLARITCLAIFIILPTTMVRPAVEPGGIFRKAMLFLYAVDEPDNLFPSIHCMASWICFIAVRKNPNVPRWYKIFSFAVALLVFMATLTTKQHITVDVIAGLLLAEGSYQFCKAARFGEVYRRMLTGRKHR